GPGIATSAIEASRNTSTARTVEPPPGRPHPHNGPVAARRETGTAPIRLPARSVGPVFAITRRLLLATAILLAVVAAVLLDRDGYRDSNGDGVGVIDAFYYATVTLSTTGYGDVAPASDAARLANVLFVAPARVLFLIIL